VLVVFVEAQSGSLELLLQLPLAPSINLHASDLYARVVVHQLPQVAAKNKKSVTTVGQIHTSSFTRPVQ